MPNRLLFIQRERIPVAFFARINQPIQRLLERGNRFVDLLSSKLFRILGYWCLLFNCLVGAFFRSVCEYRKRCYRKDSEETKLGFHSGLI